jgi:hypothetical protein
MRTGLCLAIFAVGVSSLAVGRSSAQVVFQDDFENQTVGNTVGAPEIGQPYVVGATSGLHGANIVSTPALGTKSLRITRESVPPIGPSNADISAISLPGTVVNGNTVELKVSHYLQDEGSGVFNDPLQLAIGEVKSNFNNDFTFLDLSDGGGGFPSHNYAYYTGPGQFQTKNQTNTVASINPDTTTGKWDTLRVDFHFSQLDATHMGGTFDFFVSVNGAPEVQLASNALMETADMSLSPDPTSLQVRIVKGPSSGIDYYDNMSVTVAPEPSFMGLGAVIGGILSARRARR